MPLQWRDTTGYSQSETRGKIEPRTWSAAAGDIRVTVTRRHGLDGWFLICEPWHSLKSLGEISADEAKKYASLQIRSDARALMEALGAE